MASSYEYILSLNDKVSGKLQQITGKSTDAIGKLQEMQAKTQKVQQATKDFGGSISTLRQKINLLQEERDLINPKNLTDIRKYNSEIKRLTKQVNKLETVNGNKFKKALKDGFNTLPPFLTNPAVMVGAVVGSTTKMAMTWQEGMAKINATAQLSQSELDGLGDKIKKMGVDAGADLKRVPDAYEKILSQTGDVAVSTQILDSALKGAQAGFTDVDVVSGALAQTLSAVGKENTNAEEVINTLFAAKRVGAGEFKDFANYVPSLVAAAGSVGMAWQDTAGMFAYMTGKGQDASSAAMLIQNTFTALGKGDIQKKMQKHGINIFDEKGAINSIEVIMSQMNAQMSGMSDEQKSNFIESLGLKDAQAKQAFMVLSSEADKLGSTLEAVRNPAGELEKALGNTDNPTRKLNQTMARVHNIMISVGDVMLKVLVPVLDVANILLDGMAFVWDMVGTGIGWVITQMQLGNPVLWAMTAGIAAFTIALNAATIAAKTKAVWDGIVTGVTKIWTAAQWALNAALAVNPVVWIVAGIAALVGALVAVISKTQGWSAQWKSFTNVLKYSFKASVGAIKLYWMSYVQGFMIGINKIMEGWYMFKNATGIGDKNANNEALEKIRQDTEARKQKLKDAAFEIVENAKLAKDSMKWELSWKKGEKAAGKSDEKKNALKTPGGVPPVINLSANGAGGSGLNLNNIKGSTNYGAIASKLSGVSISGLGGGNSSSSAEGAKVKALAGALKGVDSTFKQPVKTDYIKLISDNVAKIAASVVIAGTIGTGNLRSASDSSIANSSYGQEQAMPSGVNGRSIHIEKFCDQIVVHVPEGSDSDEVVRKIKDELLTELNNAFEYEA